MTSESPTHRKHGRSSSPDASEDRSKRRKHRHRHRHRYHHRRHRSSKDKEKTLMINEIQDDGEKRGIEVEKLASNNNIDEGVFAAKKDEFLISDFAGVDYDMEEGEIVDDDGLEKLKSGAQSDVESGEIEMANGFDDAKMEDNQDNVKAEEKKLENSGSHHNDSQISGNVDHGRASRSGLANGYSAHKYREIDGRNLYGDDKRSDNCDNEVEPMKRASMSSDKKHTHSPSYSQENYRSESSPGNLVTSHELYKRRSRSRSIAREAPYVGTSHEIDDPYYTERKHPDEIHRRGGRDRGGDRGRERSSSRHSERRERYFDREMRDGRREVSTERERDRDRKRENGSSEDGQRERDRSRLQGRDRDRGERERDRERERRRDSDKDRERERYRERERRKERERDWERDDRKKDRDRGREGSRDGTRAKIEDWDREYESERLTRDKKYSSNKEDYRKMDNDLGHGRHSDDDRREGSRKSDMKSASSKTVQNESSIGSAERENNLLQEDYEEKIVMQLEEQEEDDLEKIKEESRRRRQAILEKYKNLQKSEVRLQDTVENQSADPPVEVPSAEGVKEDYDSGVEGADVDDTEPSFSVGKSPAHDLSASQRPAGTSGLGEGTPKSERSADMFHDDIFGESPAEVRKTGKGDPVAVEKTSFQDNWDDAEGYYGYRFGEVLDGRYEIIAAHGKGVFSTVVRAKDLKAKAGDPEEVAIKIIRNNETMYKAGMEELVILKKLVGADPENKRHCVCFLSTFKYRNHLCLVFESLHMNLREVLKKFGRNIGLKLTAVRTYAKQLFIALKHLRNCGVLHCDIKPDNMLVNEKKSVLKLCDFGNAMLAGKNEITPYLVSRFYRAPEISLPYDHPLDMWSVGCCLFELYTGKVLFPGHTNNDMLRLHMELKGPFPKKMLRKGGFTAQHFDQDLNFLSTEEDPVSKKVVRKLIANIKPKDFGSLISGYPGEDPKMVANFKDLMEKIFVLDPDKRITVSQALSHPFITGK